MSIGVRAFVGSIVSASSALSSFTIGPFSNTSFAQGATFNGLTFQIGAASATQPGSVGTTNQIFVGLKTFNTGINTLGKIGVGVTNPTYELEVVGEVASNKLGNGFRVKEGANARMGTATLNGTTAVTVATTAVTANSRIFVTTNASGGTVGAPYVDARTAGASFTIKSTNGSDSSDVAWIIFEPA